MAAAAVLAAMNAGGDRKLHAFFTKTNVNDPSTHNEITSHDSLPAPGDGLPFSDGHNSEIPPKAAKTKPRRPRTSKASTDGRTQQTLNDIINSKPENGPADSSLEIGAITVDENAHDRKRQKLSQEPPDDLNRAPAQHDVATEAIYTAQDSVHRSPQVVISRSRQTEDVQPRTPPKKTLRLKANGKLISPIQSQVNDDEQNVRKKRKTGPKIRKAGGSAERSLIVHLPYVMRADLGFGACIDRILLGEERVNVASKVPKAAEVNPRTPRKSNKVTHPFFGKKVVQPAIEKPVSPRKTLSATTPGKLRMQTMADRATEPQLESAYSVGSELLKDRLMVKHPGAKEPPFPTQEQAHVRGYIPANTYQARSGTLPNLSARKRKQVKVPLPENESILVEYMANLRVEEDQEVRSDGFLEPSRHLTVPGRLLLSGTDIAQRIRSQVVDSPDAEADELAMTTSNPSHPAVSRLHSRIPTVLTAYDQSRGETLAWTQKYAPCDSSEVLQPLEEMRVLRDWLKSLNVNAVGGAAMDKNTAPIHNKIPRKRKKKCTEMDDFLVDDDEEELTVMNEIEHSDAPNADHEVMGRSQRSVVQSTSHTSKLSNTILLSGPSGCGKTAAAYAVAKELGYKVFEISPSERRSGKDVVDKIGNMTENHLVKHHGGNASVANGPSVDMASGDESSRLDDAFQRDLESGRQGKMASFFKPKGPKPTDAPKKAKPKTAAATKVMKDIQEALKRPTKDQQQSLILLEEVDVLFKDDKDFWPTIVKLMISSKRPFLLTCNDEALVPMQSLNFHAILRLAPPSVSHATDYMVLMAAAEGHLLEREAVASLFRYHRKDLRATISELDFWCQMGVGDPRSGLTWIFQRYPPGSDLDRHGRKLRVVSQGTYKASMSLIPSKDISAESALLWAWTEFNIEPTSALGWQDLNDTINSDADAADRLQQLKHCSRFADALSAADLICGGGTDEALRLDPGQRPLNEKQKGQYIEGRQLLQIDEVNAFSTISQEIAITLDVAAVRSSDLFTTAMAPNARSVLDRVSSLIVASEHARQLTRRAFACFDEIAVPGESAATMPTGMIQSVFDGPLRPIAEDLAPYVRSILQYDESTAEQRDRLNLLTSGAGGGKRGRSTRAARSALEGSQRSTTRREWWFTENLDVHAALATGGKDWPRTTYNPLDQVSHTDEGDIVEE